MALKKTRWLSVEKIPNFPLAPFDVINAAAAAVLTELLGVPMHGFAFHYEDGMAEFLVQDAGRDQLGAAILDKIADRHFTDSVIEKALAASFSLVEAGKAFRRAADMTDAEMADAYEHYLSFGGASMGYGYLGNLLDYASDSVDNVLLDRLEKTVRDTASDSKAAARLFLDLTTLEDSTFPLQEHRDFLELFRVIETDAVAKKILVHEPDETIAQILSKKSPESAAAIAHHQQKWAWLSFVYVGPVKWTQAYYFRLLKDALAVGGDPAVQLRKMDAMPKAIIAARKNASKTVADDAYFYAARRLAYDKAMRKDLQVQSYFYLDAFFRQVARRFGLSPIQARFFTSAELLAALRGKGELHADLANRRQKNGFFSIWDGQSVFLDGPAAEKEASNVRRPSLTISDQLQGTCGCPGKAKGIVRIVNTAEEAVKIHDGDILVSYATNPELVAAMRKAAAIVTDCGGLTCHAAIVARELNKPCVIGTKVATASFKDGDVVEVLADEGVVRKIK